MTALRCATRVYSTYMYNVRDIDKLKTPFSFASALTFRYLCCNLKMNNSLYYEKGKDYLDR